MCANPLDLVEPGLAPKEVLLDLQLDLTGDLQRRGQEHVERIVDGTFRGILDGHYAEVGDPTFHLMEDLVDGMKRQGPNRMPEVLEYGGLRERSLGPEKTDFQWFLLRQAR